MLCERCNLEEATVHMTQVIDGHARSVHLCTGCAREVGLDLHGGKLDMGRFLEDINRRMQERLEAGRADSAPPPSPADPPMPAVCPLCGMHREEVRRTLNPGCPQCFETFQPLLIPDPESFGAYAGWRPKEYPEPLELPTDRAPGLPQRPDTGEEAGDTARRGARLRDLQARLESRQRRMEAAVAAEQYEQAARLRDEIQSLRHELAAVDGGEAPPGAEGGP